MALFYSNLFDRRSMIALHSSGEIALLATIEN